MRVEEGKYSIAELVDWLRRRELVVNTEYQRGGGLWPKSAKSYFVDTILKEYPFPKIYFHERIDKETKRPKREIVDGQQRLMTILEYIDGKFALGVESGELLVEDAMASYLKELGDVREMCSTAATTT